MPIIVLQERKNIREKYPHKIYDDDEKVAQQLLIDAKERPSSYSYRPSSNSYS